MKKIMIIIFLSFFNLFGADKINEDSKLNKIINYFEYNESSFHKKKIMYEIVSTGAEESLEGYKVKNENLILIFENGVLEMIEILDGNEIFDIKIGLSYKDAQKKLGNINPKKIYLVGDDKPSYLLEKIYKGRRISFLSYSKETIDEITIYRK
ncbi:MAG: hypothetical protein JXM74_02795 [Fusobacteriaceae bacterium]|nr:hypothetical protein [Fusobacteriaceae bacterium]